MRCGPWLDYSHLIEATRTGLHNVRNLAGKAPVAVERRTTRKDQQQLYEARLLYEVDDEREPLPERVRLPEYYWDGSE